MLKNQLKEKWFRCITMHVVGSVINYLITLVIFRTGHTFIAASMLKIKLLYEIEARILLDWTQ